MSLELDTQSETFLHDLKTLIESRMARNRTETERLHDFLSTLGGDDYGPQSIDVTPRRRKMSTAARKALSKRMKAVWSRRKAATRG